MASATVIIVIGNSDRRLAAEERSRFCDELEGVALSVGQVRFAGHSPHGAPWTNHAVVVEVDLLDVDTITALEAQLADLAGRYRQDSIALIRGYAKFVAPRGTR